MSVILNGANTGNKGIHLGYLRFWVRLWVILESSHDSAFLPVARCSGCRAFVDSNFGGEAEAWDNVTSGRKMGGV